MKKSKINIGIIAAFVLIALFNQCRANVVRESKVADAIKFNTVDVQLEDILTEPTGVQNNEIVEYFMEEVPKTR